MNMQQFEQCRKLIQSILENYRDIIGKDFVGYQNHCIRMAGCCLALLSQQENTIDVDVIEKIAIAAAFHDIGIWTANTIDYLEPSIPPMMAYLSVQDKAHWSDEIRVMILEHHKITTTQYPQYPLVEIFRKADLADFSLGLVRSGVPKQTIKYLKQHFPNAGFHQRLVELTLKNLPKSPLNPLPMMKW
ncbi:hypothetical protein SAMN05421749_101449 [Acinetobacter marinus]|uniref:HD domain-containing protein n=1 Tax=Acinetobacter marinus TaxID=281375 RepID=A0A1G6GUW1_9GAMM|nr:HD domain-containing protein [Acinetobacter marinus]SDB85797.1 hypothetical protein SAMN05421749_101449 [Acinetobacter marinus]